MKELWVIVPVAFVGLVIVMWLWRSVLTVRADELVWWSRDPNLRFKFKDGRAFVQGADPGYWFNAETGAKCMGGGWLDQRLDGIAAMLDTPEFAKLERPWDEQPPEPKKTSKQLFDEALEAERLAGIEEMRRTGRPIGSVPPDIVGSPGKQGGPGPTGAGPVPEPALVNRLCICGHESFSHHGADGCSRCPPEAACARFVRRPLKPTGGKNASG